MNDMQYTFYFNNKFVLCTVCMLIIIIMIIIIICFKTSSTPHALTDVVSLEEQSQQWIYGNGDEAQWAPGAAHHKLPAMFHLRASTLCYCCESGHWPASGGLGDDYWMETWRFHCRRCQKQEEWCDKGLFSKNENER